MDFKERAAQLQPETAANLASLVSYPSVANYGEQGTPFGAANRDCLNKALAIGAGYGFKTCNLDDYVGYIEYGDGPRTIGILAHLDVVPVSPTWKTDPFKATVIGDRMYGRGTSDDKGGAVCALMAMKILSEMKPDLGDKKIRLILGCNEESGSRGIAYYVSKQGYVDMGFTPDADFPLVYGEKGMAGGLIKGHSAKIIDAKGGTARNAVPASVTFRLQADALDSTKLDRFLTDNKIGYTYTNGKDDAILTVQGTAAHAATPELGVNAISYAYEAMYQAGINDPYVTAYHNLVGLGYNGEMMGLDLSDKYGRLTCNIGMTFVQDGLLVSTIDIRFPVTMHVADITAKLQTHQPWVSDVQGVDPLFFPLDHPMIEALMDAYRQCGPDPDRQPMTMGGGTYARAMKNIVAFGCAVRQEPYHIHEDNEFVYLDDLTVQVKVYVQALLNLLKL